MFKPEDFEDIRPYHDHEINAALRRIIAVPAFDKVLEFLFPDRDKNQVKASLAEIHTAYDFQVKFMHPLVNSIVQKTSDGLTCDGFEHLTPGTPYLFVANHRDIVLDSAMLQVLLLDHGHKTSEITFGSNLMTNQFIIDLGKVNRMFKVTRGGNKTELLHNSRLLSAYIRHTITEKKNSVWIAQRSGRTKDGNDKTEPGLLKMFNMSGNSDPLESFQELNIVPLTVSYEYEPCCFFKIKELAISLTGAYIKAPDEDFISILTGITGQKGRIHMSVGKPLNHYLGELNPEDTLNNKINKLASWIDAEIYKHFKCWPSNYIAFDLLHQSEEYAGCYSSNEKDSFLEYMESQLKGFTDKRNTAKDLFLRIYANPVNNVRTG
jgi:hypothetical protein